MCGDRDRRFRLCASFLCGRSEEEESLEEGQERRWWALRLAWRGRLAWDIGYTGSSGWSIVWGGRGRFSGDDDPEDLF
jgi:hypothetical protein